MNDDDAERSVLVLRLGGFGPADGPLSADSG